MRTRIKICGITCLEDAHTAIEAGVDALGFVFAESRRRIDWREACHIVQNLPPFVAAVGVFVDEEPMEIARIASAVGLAALQFHGSEPPEVLTAVRGHTRAALIKAFRVQGPETLAQIGAYAPWCDAVLLDAFVPGAAGGTGQTFDWDLALAAKEYRRPLILAGGLNPENVFEAVRQVRPYAVDVSSGVEARPGVKDVTKIRAFVQAVRQADATADGCFFGLDK